MIPNPPAPFAPAVEALAHDAEVYRIHGNGRGPAEFNGSGRGSTRFAFFRDPAGATVPVLYAAGTAAAAVAETLLHDVPLAGGNLTPDAYETRVMNRLITTRPLRLAQFHGLGLRQLRTQASDLTDTDASEYPRTVLWAAAAHAFSDSEGPLDGIVWMSKRCNSDRAYVFFGDRVDMDDFVVDPSFAKAFSDNRDIGWLSDLCAPLGVNVLVS